MPCPDCELLAKKVAAIESGLDEIRKRSEDQAGQPAPKDGLDKFKAAAEAFGKGGLPIVLLILGSCINSSLQGQQEVAKAAAKNKEVAVELIRVSVDILHKEPDPKNDKDQGVRGWAADVLSAASKDLGYPGLSDPVRAQLLVSALEPKIEGVVLGVSDRIPQVLYNFDKKNTEPGKAVGLSQERWNAWKEGGGGKFAYVTGQFSHVKIRALVYEDPSLPKDAGGVSLSPELSESLRFDGKSGFVVVLPAAR